MLQLAAVQGHHGPSPSPLEGTQLGGTSTFRQGYIPGLTDIALDLLKDNNFSVCPGILLVLTKQCLAQGRIFSSTS